MSKVETITDDISDIKEEMKSTSVNDSLLSMVALSAVLSATIGKPNQGLAAACTMLADVTLNGKEDVVVPNSSQKLLDLADLLLDPAKENTLTPNDLVLEMSKVWPKLAVGITGITRKLPMSTCDAPLAKKVKNSGIDQGVEQENVQESMEIDQDDRDAEVLH